MKQKANNNEIHVREDSLGQWSAFAKEQGEGFILDCFETKAEAIEFASRVLYALNKYGRADYRNHDYEDKEFDEHPIYPVVVD